MLYSMTSFWPIIEQLINIVEPHTIVEIGALRGEMTRKLCEWGLKQDIERLVVIEPAPENTLLEVIENHSFASLLMGNSLEKLPELTNVQSFFIDGDHNYYTVYHELQTIMQKNNPDIIFFHDVGWPWARRDLYYNPAEIPEVYLHDYISDIETGIVPNNDGALKNQGFISHGNFSFAKKEGGSQNGVLTAIEDFLQETSNYTFFTVDCIFGLGILVRNDFEKFASIENVLNSYVNNPIITILEEDRLVSFIEQFSYRQQIKTLQDQLSDTVVIDKYPKNLPANKQSASLYIELIKKSLLDLIYTNPTDIVTRPNGQMITLAEARQSGLDWPSRALTMIGIARLNNVQFCVEQVLNLNVAGDFIETGVWRGGACIFMRALLKAYDVTERTIWVADSFRGLPPPNAEKYPLDKNLDLSHISELAISRQDVERNFARYDLLDAQVQFLEGWFKDTLPTAPIGQIAILRLDGDLYESTMDALTALYPKVSPGGFIIIDDYGAIDVCKQAVLDYRAMHNITEKIQPIDQTGVYWQKKESLQQDKRLAQISHIQSELKKQYNATLQQWLFYHQREIVLTKTYWMGVRTLKNPLDCWIYQEIIFEIQPHYIVEIGSKHGGSTLFFAHLLEVIGKGSVISVDIDRQKYQARHDRIIEITGDSGSLKIFNQVQALCQGKKVLVIHDANHDFEAVYRDMNLYADLVSTGSYFIVEDSLVDIYPSSSDTIFEPHFQGKGPLWAIEKFLEENYDFEIYSDRERYILTQSPRGFLKRIHPNLYITQINE